MPFSEIHCPSLADSSGLPFRIHNLLLLHPSVASVFFLSGETMGMAEDYAVLCCVGLEHAF